MIPDLDTRARDAASAARASVTMVAAAGSAPQLRRRGPRRLVLAGFALVVVALVALTTLGDDVTTVTTGPAGQGAPVPRRPPGTPPPMPDLGIAGPFGTELVRGTASDGRAWALYLSNTPNTPAGSTTETLCLGLDLRIPGMSGGACGGGPFGAPASPYHPIYYSDTRAPYFVGGRVEPDVSAITVVLADGTRLGPSPVIQAQGGPYYAVEVPSGSPPETVIGHRGDGTSVRYDR